MWENLKQNIIDIVCRPTADLGRKSLNEPIPKGKVPGRNIPYILANHMKAGMLYAGNSMIVNAEGNILAQAGPNADEIIVAICL